MKSKIAIFVALILVVTIICIVAMRFYQRDKNEANISYNEIAENLADNIIQSEIIEKIGEEEKMSSSIKVIINNKTYNASLEQNETAKQFVNMLPQEFNMNELNGNEKYVYLDTILPTNSYNPKHIEAGDIMLYGNNCLVIFYKSFDTSYSYTKIGHIENFEDLGNKNVTMKFEEQ